MDETIRRHPIDTMYPSTDNHLGARMLRDIRELTDSPEEYAAELAGGGAGC